LIKPFNNCHNIPVSIRWHYLLKVALGNFLTPMRPLPFGYTEPAKDRKDIVKLSPEAQERHIAVLGKTRTGKSTLLHNMLYVDIRHGEGVGLIDPHGDLAEEVLEVIPCHRRNDLIYFDPLDDERIIGFNPMVRVPDKQKPLVVSSIISILKNIWADFWGPRTEYILASLIAALLDQKQPVSFLALLKALVDDDYRKHIEKKLDDPIINLFFQMYNEEWSDRFRSEAAAPLMNKIGKLLGNPLLRNVLGQATSSFSTRWMIDTRKIFLCNLSKGLLGDDVASLFGSLFVSSITLAALSRKDILEAQRIPFKLYVDEAGSFMYGVDYSTILSQTGKYKLSLVLAMQTTAQLPAEALADVFGNCSTLICFRVGATDAEILSSEFARDATMSQIQNIADYQAYVKTITRLNLNTPAKMPTQADVVHTLPPLVPSGYVVPKDQLLEDCRIRYGRLKAEVEMKQRKFLSQ
jgi:hypothetical protein